MGQYQYQPKEPKEEENEKELKPEELLELLKKNRKEILRIKYKKNRLCQRCHRNEIPKQMQLSSYSICRDCYLKEKAENNKYMIDVLSKNTKLIFHGNEIIPEKLYLGSVEDSFQKDELKKLNITHILMVGYYLNELYPKDFTYLNFEIDDNQNEDILKYFIPGIKFIENSKICFCHCIWGKSRSASIVIAYVMYHFKYHFADAFLYVRKRRRNVMPNYSFEEQLTDFSSILRYFDYDLQKVEDFINKIYDSENYKKEKNLKIGKNGAKKENNN